MDIESGREPSLDENLGEAMDVTFEIISTLDANLDTPDQLRMRIVAHNLKAISQVILMADDNPQIEMNLKQLTLAILGTSDWLFKFLPELEEQVT